MPSAFQADVGHGSAPSTIRCPRLTGAQGLELSLIAVLTFFSATVVSAIIFENGDIEHRWYVIKAWTALDFPNFPANHHNMRWGISLPATIIVWLLGDSPRVYLAINYLAFALATTALYALVRYLASSRVAAVILAVWLFNPITYWLPANLMPELYGILYLAVALLFLRTSYDSGSHRSYALAILALFLAYGAKETNIFFMPGLVLYELFRRRYANVAIITAVFGGGVLVETLTVDFILRDSHILLGRAEAIMRGGYSEFLKENVSHFTPADMFRRWWFTALTRVDRLEYYSKVLYWVFFGGSIWLIRRWLAPPGDQLPLHVRPAAFMPAVVALGASFALCTTFFVISLRPFRMGQPMDDRYLWILLIPALLVLAQILASLEHHLTTSGGARARKRVLLWNSVCTNRRVGNGVLVVLILAAIFPRLAIEAGLVNIRRVGHAFPYSFFTVNSYFDQIRERLRSGCTLIFATRRAAWSALIYSFPYDYFPEPVRFYKRALEDMPARDGSVLRVSEPQPADWVGLASKLHVVPYPTDIGTNWELLALRLETSAEQVCLKTYYIGHVDIHPRDQEVVKSGSRE